MKTNLCKTISIISTFFILTTLLSLPIHADDFSLLSDFKCKSELNDVNKNSELCYYVNFLYYNGIISGYSDNTYREDNEVTRAEFSKYISNSFSLTKANEELEELEFFDDVDENHKFFQYIYSLKKLGIIHGYSDGLFKPDDAISRDQATKFIANSAQYMMGRDINSETDFFYTDIPEDSKFSIFLKRLINLSEKEHYLDQILNLNEPAFRPNEMLTRKDLSKMMSNAVFLANIPHYSKLPRLSELAEKIQSDEKNYDNGAEIQRFGDIGVTMIGTDGDIELVYTRENIKPLNEFAEEENFSFAVNGSYFGSFKRERPLSDLFDSTKDYVMIENTESYLRVRATPSTDTDDNIIGKLYDFEIVEKKDEETDWFEIYDKVDDITGWISKEFSREINLEEEKQYYWEYLHAGWLNYYGEHLFPVKRPEEDSKVTHFVRYDTSTKEMEVFNLEDFSPKDEGDDRYLEFQTGPIMYKDGEIKLAEIERANGTTNRRPRNVLIISEDKKSKYLAVTAGESYSLKELVLILLNIDEFALQEVTMISLDGGSSVQLYADKFPEYNFNADRSKPIVIGIK